MMPEWIPDILKAVLPGIIIAALTSILTVRLAIRRFHEEKWWERNKRVRALILTSLLTTSFLKSSGWENIGTPY